MFVCFFEQTPSVLQCFFFCAVTSHLHHQVQGKGSYPVSFHFTYVLIFFISLKKNFKSLPKASSEILQLISECSFFYRSNSFATLLALFENSLFTVFRQYILLPARSNWALIWWAFMQKSCPWIQNNHVAPSLTVISVRWCVFVVWLQLPGARGPHVNILLRTKEKMRVQLEQLWETQ